MTVPHCYPSVVCNTSEIAIEVSIRVKVQFIVNAEGTRVVVGGSTKVNATTRAKVTTIVTCGVATMSAGTIVELMRGTGDSVSLIDVREAMGTG